MGLEEDGFEISAVRMASIQLHELYMELRHAGFSKREALYLVSKMATSGMENEE